MTSGGIRASSYLEKYFGIRGRIVGQGRLCRLAQGWQECPELTERRAKRESGGQWDAGLKIISAPWVKVEKTRLRIRIAFDLRGGDCRKLGT